MPHVDITMSPGRNDQAKKEIAEKVQNFLAKELGIDKGFVSVSIEDIPKEKWQEQSLSFYKLKIIIVNTKT